LKKRVEVMEWEESLLDQKRLFEKLGEIIYKREEEKVRRVQENLLRI
jgi:hypothetical protein